MVRLFSCFVLLLAGTAALQAQKSVDLMPNFKEGYIRYQMETNGPPTDIVSFVEGSTLSFYFKNEWSKTELAILAGVARMQLITPPEGAANTLLMDIPTVSEKTAVALEGQDNLFSFLKPTETVNQTPSIPKAQTFKNKTKRIAGYRCHRVELTAPNGSLVVLYVTNKIRTSAPLQLPWTSQIEGIPLAVEFALDGSRFRLVADRIERTPLFDSLFEVPSDYTHQDMDEFKDEIQEKLGIGKGSVRYGL